ncbi:hypothetical protein [Cumulibacter soli]|uniref:hypothetical protein n=1 Tax=Cumulibacter soli TaxID=2546344 RepID=UPI001067579D|nr:hypothetical protein [Cumulibacter soli]
MRKMRKLVAGFAGVLTAAGALIASPAMAAASGPATGSQQLEAALIPPNCGDTVSIISKQSSPDSITFTMAWTQMETWVGTGKFGTSGLYFTVPSTGQTLSTSRSVSGDVTDPTSYTFDVVDYGDVLIDVTVRDGGGTIKCESFLNTGDPI